MLWMVIERFKAGALPVGERWREKGRMMPEGVLYHGSWLDPAGKTCFQLMEAETGEALTPWMERWSDLMDFEVIPVLASADFWAGFWAEREGPSAT
jgi:hypothetical protein